MKNRIPTGEQDRLADHLRQEARATRPEFSQELHERIRQAVRQDELLLARNPPAASWRQRLMPLTVAAALLLGVSLTAFWVSGPPDRGPEATRPAESVKTTESVADPFELAGETGRAAEHLGLLMDSALSQQQWGYLDHDLQLAARLLIDQLPLAEVPDEELRSEPVPQSSSETPG